MATEVTVPMVGKIVGVNVKVGDKVAEEHLADRARGVGRTDDRDRPGLDQLLEQATLHGDRPTSRAATIHRAARSVMVAREPAAIPASYPRQHIPP